MMIPQEEEEGERELLSRAAGGEAMAARTLLNQTGDILYGFIYARVGGDLAVAEDLVQSTYLEALRSAKTFRGESSISTWLCAIARRQVARHYETERRRERTDSHLQVVSDLSLESDQDKDFIADQDEIIRALGALTPLHRQVLVMKYLDDLSVSEIGTRVGRTNVQVQSLLQRARAALKRELERFDA